MHQAPSHKTGDDSTETPTQVYSNQPSPGTSKPYPRVQGRIHSLDALRGLTIALMLLVNNVPPGVRIPPQFTHAAWGEMIHLADLVFPWLLFCMGVAIPLAYGSFLRRRLPAWRWHVKAVIRSSALFALGCIVESSVQMHFAITMGVLQLIALAYLATAFLAGTRRWQRLLTAIILLVGYWATLRFWPVPGHQAKISETENVVYYLNVTLLGPLNLRGILSVIPTTALVLLGTVVGDWLRSRHDANLVKVARLLTTGVLLVLLGLWWQRSVPFSKALWSPSYILLTAGLATALLAMLYALVDWAGWLWLVYPFCVLGSNAIVAYVAPIIVKIWFLRNYSLLLHGHAVTLEQWGMAQLVQHYGSPTGEWAYTGLLLAAWWVVLWLLHWKKWYVRV